MSVLGYLTFETPQTEVLTRGISDSKRMNCMVFGGAFFDCPDSIAQLFIESNHGSYPFRGVVLVP